MDILHTFPPPSIHRLGHSDIWTCKDCKDSLGCTVEQKNIFVNSIFYGKKNRFVGRTGLEKDEPVIKGLDGLSDSNPFWVQNDSNTL